MITNTHTHTHTYETKSKILVIPLIIPTLVDGTTSCIFLLVTYDDKNHVRKDAIFLQAF